MTTVCLIPDCERYTSRFTGPGAWFICATHWARVPKAMRRTIARCHRRLGAGRVVSEAAYRRIVSRAARAVLESYR